MESLANLGKREREKAAEAHGRRKEKEDKAEEAERIAEEKNRRKWERNYSSQDSGVEQANVAMYYCTYCAAFAFVCDRGLDRMPTRALDGSKVLKEKKHLFKPSMEEGETVKLKREGGTEVQYRLNCTQCGLALAYRAVPHAKKDESKFCYFIKGAVTTDPDASLRKLKQGVDNSLQAIYEAEEKAGLFVKESSEKSLPDEEQAAKRQKK